MDHLPLYVNSDCEGSYSWEKPTNLRRHLKKKVAQRKADLKVMRE